jgi:putative transposase
MYSNSLIGPVLAVNITRRFVYQFRWKSEPQHFISRSVNKHGGKTVAQPKSTSIRRECNKIFPKKRLEKLARETEVIQRQGKIKIVDVFWTLVLGFGGAGTRTLAGLRRAFEKTTGITVVPSAFYDRFTPALAKFMKINLSKALEKAGLPERSPRGCLAAFKDVLTTDSTLVRLHDLLEKKWPACRTNHTKASLKAHVIMSVTGKGPASIKITSGRTNDGPVLKAGRWVRDRLLLFDLGYYRFQLFARIGECGGYYVSRLKDNANPIITGVNQRWRGRSVKLVGEKLQDVLSNLKRDVLDVKVELAFKRRTYQGCERKDILSCRLVGVKNHETGVYHLYLTNVPQETLSAKEVGNVYRARWLIELAFRELKSSFEMETMPSSKAHIVESRG